MRQIDKLPMVVRFVSDLIQSDPHATTKSITDRAFELANIIAEKMSHEPEFYVNRNGVPKRGFVKHNTVFETGEAR